MLRFFGYCCALLALVAFGYDIWRGPVQEQDLVFTSTAEYWAEAHRASLIGLNSFIEKKLSPDVWDLAVLPAITWPAFVLAGLFALVFFILAPRRVRQAKGGLMFPKGRR